MALPFIEKISELGQPPAPEPFVGLEPVVQLHQGRWLEPVVPLAAAFALGHQPSVKEYFQVLGDAGPAEVEVDRQFLDGLRSALEQQTQQVAPHWAG